MPQKLFPTFFKPQKRDMSMRDVGFFIRLIVFTIVYGVLFKVIVPVEYFAGAGSFGLFVYFLVCCQLWYSADERI